MCVIDKIVVFYLNYSLRSAGDIIMSGEAFDIRSVDTFSRTLLLNRIDEKLSYAELARLVAKLVETVKVTPNTIIKSIYIGLSEQFLDKSISEDQWIQIRALLCPKPINSTPNTADNEKKLKVYDKILKKLHLSDRIPLTTNPKISRRQQNV